MERPFDYASGSFESRNAASCLNSMAQCRRYIVQYSGTIHADIFRNHWFEWLRLHRYYKAQEHKRNTRRISFWS